MKGFPFREAFFVSMPENGSLGRVASGEIGRLIFSPRGKPLCPQGQDTGLPCNPLSETPKLSYF